MDFSALLKVLGPMMEPVVEQAVNAYWPQLDAAIGSIPQADERLLLQGLSPVLKAFVVAEMKKYMAGQAA